MDEIIEGKNITYHFIDKVKVGKIWHRRYECSSCKLEYPLMFPEGVVCDPRSVRKGYLKCMCSSRRRFSNDVWKIYINSYLDTPNLVATEVYDKGDYKYVKGYCKICKDVDYLPNNYDCSLTTLERGHLPCGCADSFQWSIGSQELRIKNRCKDLGVKFLGFLGEYENNSSKIIIEFCDGFQQTPIIANFMNRDYNDPRNTSSGFNPSKPAHLYIVRWFNENVSYLKFGITNQKVQQRITQQARKSELDYEILHTFHHESGQRVADCERLIKASMQTSICPKALLPDGYTETVHDTIDNLQHLVQTVGEYFN